VVAAGYFGKAEKENTNFKEIDGTRYFCTGDIGEVMSNGTIKIIGNKKRCLFLHSKCLPPLFPPKNRF
jgi:long-subunit acyl-CoA synthetase (AMP-forming)